MSIGAYCVESYLFDRTETFFPQMMKTFPFHASYLILQYYELMQITRNKRISALENLIVLTVVITKL